MCSKWKRKKERRKKIYVNVFSIQESKKDVTIKERKKERKKLYVNVFSINVIWRDTYILTAANKQAKEACQW